MANVTPTETFMPTLTFTPTVIPTATSVPTFVYLPTITLVPSPTPFSISPSVLPVLESQHSQANYDNVFTVTIEEERFVYKRYRDVVYQVLLNFKNSSEKEIRVFSELVTYKNKDYKVYPDIYDYADFQTNVLGSDGLQYTIPTGESHIVFDVSIFVTRNDLQCTDGSLDKPLYLLLFFGPLGNGNTDSPLKVSNDLNQKILEIPCTWD